MTTSLSDLRKWAKANGLHERQTRQLERSLEARCIDDFASGLLASVELARKSIKKKPKRKAK
jgi:hypothetical protein